MSSQDERLFLLAYIERHIAEGHQHIAKMQLLIADGERRRFDMTEAKLRLAQFLTTQACRQAHRTQVLAQLGGAA